MCSVKKKNILIPAGKTSCNRIVKASLVDFSTASFSRCFWKSCWRLFADVCNRRNCDVFKTSYIHVWHLYCVKQDNNCKIRVTSKWLVPLSPQYYSWKQGDEWFPSSWTWSTNLVEIKLEKKDGFFFKAENKCLINHRRTLILNYDMFN